MRSATTRKRRVGPSVESLEGRQLLASVLQFPVMPQGTFVGQMAAGPGGDVWFLKQTKQGSDFSLELASTLANISPDGKVTDYPLPGETGGFSSPQALATGPDGSLYILTEFAGQPSLTFGIDRIAPDGTLTQLSLSKPIVTGEFYKYPFSVPNGSFGQNVPAYTSIYFTVGGDSNIYISSSLVAGYSGGYEPFRLIDRITPEGNVTEINTGRYSQSPLAVTSDGSVWFAGSRLLPNGTVMDFSPPSGGAIQSLVAAADGNVYFTETFNDPNRAPLIAKITPGGQITEYPLSNPGGGVGQLTRGANGNIWFTETANVSADPTQNHIYKVGEINTAGVISETTVNSSTDAFVDVDAGSITTGPNGQIWFAENSYAAGHSSIGELVLAHGSLTVTGLKQVTPRGKSSDIVLTFSEALASAQAQRLANYLLQTQARPGHKARTVRISSAVYNDAKHTVTLHVSARLNPQFVYQITVNGSTSRGVASTDGVLLSGNGTGLPGSNYLAIVPDPTTPPRQPKK
jgi:virginiamycin B lyase